MIAGALEVQLYADVARLVQGMREGERVVNAATANINRAVDGTKRALEALGVTLSAAYFTGLVRGSIDAADHLGDLSATLNIAVEDLAGLKLLAAQNGTEFDGLAKGVGKLQVEMGKTPDKFRALGITALDGVGALKQLSDMFLLLQDTNQRNALAQAVFGKSWAELAPILSQGSAKIGETIEKGAQLSGITTAMAQAADEFNDKLAELIGTHGLLNGQVATLLPLLNQLASDFIALRGDVAQADDGFHPLAETLRAIIILGGNVAFVLRGIGTDVGAMAAQLAAAARGDFAAVGAIHEMAVKDAQAAREAFDAWERKMLSVSTSLQAVGDTSDALSRRLAVQGRSAQDAAAARAAAFLKDQQAAKSAADEYASLMQRLGAFTAAQQLELQQRDRLTEGQRMALGLLVQLRDGKLKLTEAQKAALGVALREALVAEQAADAHKAHRKAIEELTKAHADYVAALEDEISKGDEELRRLDETNAKIGLTTRQVAELEAQKHEAKAASLELLAADAAAWEGEYQLYQKLAQQQRDMAERIRQGAGAQEAVDNFKTMWQSIDETAHDVWTNIWHGGSNVFEKLGHTLKASLLDMLYQMTVRPWLLNIVANVTGAGGGIAGMAANGAVQAGVSSLTGGLNIGGLSGISGLTNGLSAWGSGGSVAGMFSNPGLYSFTELAGAALPIVGGIALVASLLDKHGGPKTESSFGSEANGRGDAGGATSIAQAIQQQYASIAGVLGLPTDIRGLGVSYAKDPQGTAKTQLEIRGGSYSRIAATGGYENVGRSDQDFQDAVARASAQLIIQNLQEAAGGKVGDFLRSIDITSASLDTLQQALQIAQDVGVVTQAIDALGSTFASLKGLSVDNTEALVKQFGSAQALASGLTGFADKFLTEGEKQALLQQRLAAAFAEANAALPDSIESYKAAVLEAQKHLDSDEGRRVFQVLIDNAGLFYGAAQTTASGLQVISEASDSFLQGYTSRLMEAAQSAKQAAVDAAAEWRRTVGQIVTSTLSSAIDQAQKAYDDALAYHNAELENGARQLTDFADSLRKMREGLDFQKEGGLTDAQRYAALKAALPNASREQVGELVRQFLELVPTQARTRLDQLGDVDYAKAILASVEGSARGQAAQMQQQATLAQQQAVFLAQAKLGLAQMNRSMFGATPEAQIRASDQFYQGLFEKSGMTQAVFEDWVWRNLNQHVSLPSYDVGSWNVPKTGPAMLHGGETVMNRDMSDGMVGLLSKIENRLQGVEARLGSIASHANRGATASEKSEKHLLGAVTGKRPMVTEAAT